MIDRSLRCFSSPHVLWRSLQRCLRTEFHGPWGTPPTLKRREALWTAVAAATAFCLRFIRPRCKGQRRKSGSCCYRSPKCLRHSHFHNSVARNSVACIGRSEHEELNQKRCRHYLSKYGCLESGKRGSSPVGGFRVSSSKRSEGATKETSGAPICPG